MFTRNCISDSKLKPNEVKCKLIEQNRILKPQAQAMSSFFGKQVRTVFVYVQFQQGLCYEIYTSILWQITTAQYCIILAANKKYLYI